MQHQSNDAASRRGGALRRALAVTGFVAIGATTAVAGPVARHPSEGLASFYGREHHGGPTASGERFDMRGLTAAHRSLPFGTRLEITNIANGRSVVVRINDRGPYVRSRVVDVSRAAAEQLGFVRSGVTRVRLRPVEATASAAPIVLAANEVEETAEPSGLSEFDRHLIERTSGRR
jgi:rare lipoprotein A